MLSEDKSSWDINFKIEKPDVTHKIFSKSDGHREDLCLILTSYKKEMEDPRLKTVSYRDFSVLSRMPQPEHVPKNTKAKQRNLSREGINLSLKLCKR